jgi:hypothetical protein
MRINYSKIHHFTAMALGLMALPGQMPSAVAGEIWSVKLTPQILLANYSGSERRDSMLSYGAFISADYLDSGGVTFGYNQTDVEGKNRTDPDIDESVFYISGKYHYFPGVLPGKLTFRLDAYSVEDKSTTTQTVGGGGGMGGRVITSSSSFIDDITAWQTLVAFINYEQTYYLDLGYAYSSYDYDADSGLSDNTVYQFTPTVGFAWNERYDWLQARGYFIFLDHGDNTDDKSTSQAVEFKWTHWFEPDALLHLHNATATLLAGNRLFPIDPDAAAIYSVTDYQNSSASVALRWHPTEQTYVMLMGGYDRYTNLDINNDYSSFYGYANLSFNW